MSEDWIPISVALPSKPEVIRIATLTKRSPDEVVGVLIRFWSWAQQHSSDGTFPGMTKAMAAAACHISDKILDAMELVGWLTSTEYGISIPNFDRWLGRGAKARFLERQKKRIQRAHRDDPESKDMSSQCQAKQLSRTCPDSVPNLSRACPDSVPNLSRCERDKNGTTLQYNTDTVRSIPSFESNGNSERICIGESYICTETKNDCGELDASACNSPPPDLNANDGKDCLISDGIEMPKDISGLTFPCDGNKGQWRVPPEFYGTLKTSYHTVDVDRELRKAYAWLVANPSKRKTARGMSRFLVNWLNRAVDRGNKPPPQRAEIEEDIYA
jgi:hypothetical protein